MLLDVDHSPRHLLSPAHAPFYSAVGLARLATRLRDLTPEERAVLRRAVPLLEQLAQKD